MSGAPQAPTALRVAVRLLSLTVAIVVGALALFRAEALPPVGGSIDLDSTSADLTVYGSDAGDYSGVSVAAGDVNGDTIDDLIIGAPWADSPGGSNAGETYVIYGGDSLSATIDLHTNSADLTVHGDGADDHSGVSVAAGDIDGDTTDDLIIGAKWADPSGRSKAGETYVIYGGDSLPATIDLNSTSASLTVHGSDAYDMSGSRVAAGDINGDTTDDLIITAYGADGPNAGTVCGAGQVGDRCEAGETYVIFGGSDLPATIDLNSTSADLTVYGDDAGDNSGISVAAGDINGDATRDLIIGAHVAEPVGGPGAGETYVIYGGDGLPATIDLDITSAGLTVYGDDAGDYSGLSVAAGDINADNADDIIISARVADPPGGASAGETYVIFGGGGLPATIDLDSTSADLTVYGDDAGDMSGSGVAAGDINGDDYYDIIIGADLAGPAGAPCAGETYVIYGGESLPSTIDLDSISADLTVYGDDPVDYSGRSVAAADINGDGTDDLIIGAELADGSGTGNSCDYGVGDHCTAGETYVVYGGPLDPTPTSTATSTPTPVPTSTVTPCPPSVCTPTPTPACTDREGDTDCDDPADDPDDDGCTDAEEAALGDSFDPVAWYDVYDVPVPAKADADGANGRRNSIVDLGDVLAVLFYAFADDDGPPNANGVDYDSAKGWDGDGDSVNDASPIHHIEEGLKYDRSPGEPPSSDTGIDPAGPPNGVIDIGDVLTALAQAFVVDCTP